MLVKHDLDGWSRGYRRGRQVREWDGHFDNVLRLLCGLVKGMIGMESFVGIVIVIAEGNSGKRNVLLL